MTKLTAIEIKGLIEKKGSNFIDVEVLVRNDIFSIPLEEQQAIASIAATGISTVKVKGFNVVIREKNEVPKGLVALNVTLEITEHDLEEIEINELFYARKTANSFFVKNPLSVSELKEIVDNGINSFIVSIPNNVLTSDRGRTLEQIKPLISEEIKLNTKNAHLSMVTQNFFGSYDVEIKVSFSNLAEQVNSEFKRLSKIDAIKADPFAEVELLTERISALEAVEKMTGNKDTKGEVDFHFLVEIPYEKVRDERNRHFVLEEVFKSMPSHDLVPRYEDRAVGFNPENGAVIVLVSGSIVL